MTFLLINHTSMHNIAGKIAGGYLTVLHTGVSMVTVHQHHQLDNSLLPTQLNHAISGWCLPMIYHWCLHRIIISVLWVSPMNRI